ncbi:ATP-dependent Clp protease adapter ClpS [Candidatus Magnetobacterium casense]|uniref:ATP-dependent Clp protease adapter protein ClpS n=1 Tax=Candidatus Magnetobacterium casense TaxID=1455061 RepID=A0ABS6S342_9BACT|nr:ATP-dependent Clp protease adapter ClpS [Candidatus Magnetobacterium casensis]MBV6343273.1 ATP-dependent Clp protease adapter ClpS [Candidatus Magnetobacterium casensis]
MGQSKGEIQEAPEGSVSEELQTPTMYKVFILNDDYTTMEFVVNVLETIFHKTSAEATQLMLQIHRSGSGLCGIYTRDIAETKVAAVHEMAKNNEFPLKCVMEEE